MDLSQSTRERQRATGRADALDSYSNWRARRRAKKDPQAKRIRASALRTRPRMARSSAQLAVKHRCYSIAFLPLCLRAIRPHLSVSNECCCAFHRPRSDSSDSFDLIALLNTHRRTVCRELRAIRHALLSAPVSAPQQLVVPAACRCDPRALELALSKVACSMSIT